METNQVASRPNAQVLSLCVALFGAADGRVVDRQSTGSTSGQYGLDLFTPFVSRRRIEAIGAAKKLLSAGLRIIHAASVIEYDEETSKDGRLDCANPHGPLAQRGYGVWWSVPFFEYSNQQGMNAALQRARAGRGMDAVLPVVSFTELEEHVKEQLASDEYKKYANMSDDDFDKLEDTETQLYTDLRGTRETINALRSMKRVMPAVPGFENPSPRIDLRNTLILYSPSSGPGDGHGGLWTNPAVRGANVAMSDPTDGVGTVNGLQ